MNSVVQIKKGALGRGRCFRSVATRGVDEEIDWPELSLDLRPCLLKRCNIKHIAGDTDRHLARSSKRIGSSDAGFLAATEQRNPHPGTTQPARHSSTEHTCATSYHCNLAAEIENPASVNHKCVLLVPSVNRSIDIRHEDETNRNTRIGYFFIGFALTGYSYESASIMAPG
jgi:hypothetical protein